VTLRKSGRNYLGLCPFHSEKTPSFTVNSEKQIFHCFGCGEGGNVFNFIMKIEGKSFPEAVRELAVKAGITVPGAVSVTPSENSARDKILEANEYSAKFYRYLLTDRPEGAVGLKYLEDREIGREAADKHRLGFAPGNGTILRDALVKKGFGEEILIKAGLVFKRDSGGTMDMFRNRVVFPIIDLHGRVVAFGGRTIYSDKSIPKYINTGETPVFTKGDTLFGAWNARVAMKKDKHLTLVEGYLDLIQLDQAGFESCAATGGTALTRRHVETIRRLTTSLNLCFDGDEAGREAVLRAAELLIPTELNVKVIVMPDGIDPDLFIKQYGPSAFKSRLEESVPIMDFIIEHTLSAAGSGIQDRTSAFDVIARYLSLVKNEIRVKMEIGRISERLGIDERLASKRMLELAERPDRFKKGEAPPNIMISKARTVLPKAEVILLLAAITRPALVKTLDLDQVATRMEDTRLSHLLRRAVEESDKNPNASFAAFMDKIEDEDIRSSLSALSLEGSQISGANGERMVRDCVDRIMKQNLSEAIKQLDVKLRESQNRGDKQQVKLLLQEKMTLLKNLKNSGE